MYSFWISIYVRTIEVHGEEVAKRRQIPLILAWALSIHKCQGLKTKAIFVCTVVDSNDQVHSRARACVCVFCLSTKGMSLSNVQCELGNVFTTGQAYVALSRARTLEGLSLISMPRSFKTDAIVVKFYDDLEKNTL